MEKQEGDGERETKTQILNTKSKRPKCSDRQAGHPSRGPAPQQVRFLEAKRIKGSPGEGVEKGVNSNCKAKCENR